MVVAGGLTEDFRAVLDATALGVLGAEIEPADAGKGYGVGAHGARLQRHVKIAMGEARRAKAFGRRPDGQKFRVGRGVIVGLNQVMAAGEDSAGPSIDDDGAHRHLAPGRCAPGVGESFSHGIGPGYWVSRHGARVAVQSFARKGFAH